MADIIAFPGKEAEKEQFCASITIWSSGRVTLDVASDMIKTRAQAAWALANFTLGIADLVELKRGMPDTPTQGDD